MRFLALQCATPPFIPPEKFDPELRVIERDGVESDPIRPRRLSGLSLLLACATCVALASCANIGESIVDSAFDSIFESKSDRRIDSDTRRMEAGEPLKYHSSERRLRLAREDRMLDDMMDD
jgi:hypothetical protein